MSSESWKDKFNFKKQSEGYTPLHTSRSDPEPHTTWRGSDHTVHVYGADFPFPIGNSPDKWFPNKKEFDSPPSYPNKIEFNPPPSAARALSSILDDYSLSSMIDEYYRRANRIRRENWDYGF